MTDDIEIGVMLSPFGDRASRKRFAELTQEAERLGFDSVWAGDHIVFPEEIPDDYPFSASGVFPLGSSDDVYEPFQVLSYLAGITETIHLGINACVVPYRHPVLLAKNILTLEALSEGRFDLGVAPGWLRTEFEVLDVPFEERGRRTDEFLRLFEQIRHEGECSFDGEFHSFQKTGFHPIPPAGRPKIWIGGKSSASIRRVAEFGNGWTIFWDHPDDIAETRARIMRAWTDFDREGTPEIAVVRPTHVGEDDGVDKSKPLVGDPESVIDSVEAYERAGTTRIVLDFYDDELESQLEQLRRFGEQVLPSL